MQSRNPEPLCQQSPVMPREYSFPVMLREQHHTPVTPKEQQFLVMLRERSECSIHQPVNPNTSQKGPCDCAQGAGIGAEVQYGHHAAQLMLFPSCLKSSRSSSHRAVNAFPSCCAINTTLQSRLKSNSSSSCCASAASRSIHQPVSPNTPQTGPCDCAQGDGIGAEGQYGHHAA